jgi:hypothetical protein
MKPFFKIGQVALPVLLLGGICDLPVHAQSPATVAPIVVDTAVPIIVNVLKPKPKATGLGKFEGYVVNSSIAQITVRAKDNERALQTFSLSQQMSEKMVAVLEKGGYQFGDKVTVYYDQTNLKALKVKGKPSRPI